MLRREFLVAVNGYEPGRRRVDDPELLSRLLNDTSIRFANLPDFLYLYRQHDQARNPAGYAEEMRLKRFNLKRLGHPEPDAVLDRLAQLQPFNRLPWAERRRTKLDFKRLIDGMVAHNWVDAADRPLLIAEMNRLLERASPRLWQMFCHWYRHRVKRHLPLGKG